MTSSQFQSLFVQHCVEICGLARDAAATATDGKLPAPVVRKIEQRVGTLAWIAEQMDALPLVEIEAAAVAEAAE